MEKKYIKGIVTLLVLTSIFALTAAYRTDHKAKVNTFTSGKVSISLTEEKYNLPENVKARKDIAPLEKVIKDPKITNKGKSSAYVFIELFMPRTDRIRIDDAGQKLPIGYRDAFLFTKNTGWLQVEKEVVTVSGKEYYRYVYAYATGTASSGKMTALKKGKSTPTLFVNDELEHRNFIESEEKVTYDIPIFAYAVQTTNLGSSLPSTVWNIIKEQKQSEGRK